MTGYGMSFGESLTDEDSALLDRAILEIHDRLLTKTTDSHIEKNLESGKTARDACRLAKHIIIERRVIWNEDNKTRSSKH